MEEEPKAEVLVPDLNTEGLEAPKEPKGEVSEPANEPKAEEAKADVGAGFSEVEVEAAVKLELPSEANGDDAAALPNALFAKA